MRVLHHLRRVVLLLLGAVAALALCAWIVLQTPWTHERVRGEIERQAAKLFNGTLQVGAVRGSLLTGITLDQVALTRHGATVFTADRIDVQYSLPAVLRAGGHVVAAVRVDHPTVRMGIEQGHWDIVDWMRPRPHTPGATPLELDFPWIQVVDGRVETTMDEGGVWRIPPVLAGVNAEVALRLGAAPALDLRHFSCAVPGSPFRATGVEGRLAFSHGIAFDQIHVATDGGGTLTVTGDLGEGEPRPLTLDVALHAFDTAVWRPWSSVLTEMQLVASGPVHVSGTTRDTRLDTTLTTTTGDVTARVTFTPASGDRTKIGGAAGLTRANLRYVLNAPDWTTDITGHADFDVLSPGPHGSWQSTVHFTGGPVTAFGAHASTVTADFTTRDSHVAYTVAGIAYGATVTATGTLDIPTTPPAGNALAPLAPPRGGPRDWSDPRDPVESFAAVAAPVPQARGRAANATPPVAINLSGTATHVDLRKLPADWGWPKLQSDVNATSFAVHHTDGEWHVDATLAPSTIEGVSLGAGTMVKVDTTPSQVDVFADGPVRHLDAQRLGVALDIAALTDPRFATDVNGHLHVSGTGPAWPALTLNVRGDLTGSRAFSADIPAATFEATRAAGGETRAQFNGRIAGFDPAAVGAPPGVAGAIAGQLDATIAWNEGAPDPAATLTASGHLDASSSRVGGLAIDQGVADGDWHDGQFDARQLAVTTGGITLEAQGPIAVTQGTSSATITASAADASSLDRWLPAPITGGPLSADARLTGTADHEHLTGTAHASVLAYGSYGSVQQPAVAFDVSLDQWTTLAGGTATADAERWDLGGERVDAPHLAATFESATEAAYQATAAIAGVHAALAGRADWSQSPPRVVVSAFEAEQSGTTWRLTPSSGPVVFTGASLAAAHVDLANGPQHLRLDGTIDLGAGGTAAASALQVDAVDIDLASLDALVGRDWQVSGTASGTLTLHGGLDTPVGALHIDGRDLSIRGYKVATVTGGATLGAGAAAVDVQVRQPDNATFAIGGRVPLAGVLPAGALAATLPTPDWDVSVTSAAVNLAVVETITPWVDQVRGQARVSLTVTGAATHPRLGGTIDVAGGGFHVPFLGTSFDRLAAELDFTSTAVAIKQFSVDDAQGHRLTMSGSLAVSAQQIGALDVTIEADRIAIMNNPLGMLELSSLMVLQGDLTRPSIEGNVEVNDGRIDADRLVSVLNGYPLRVVATQTDLPPEGITYVNAPPSSTPVAPGAAAPTPAAAPPAPSVLDRLALSLNLQMPDNLQLRGAEVRPNGPRGWSLGAVNVILGGNIQATRTPSHPYELHGNVTTVRGSYEFEGRRFDIERGGQIIFVGLHPPNPTVSIDAVRTIQGVEARVNIHGTARQPELTLSSNLPLDQADVLSLIIFNQPTTTLATSQRAAFVNAATSIAGGFVTAPLARELGRALDLDVLEIETTTLSGGVVPRVRVGEQLTTRLFAAFSQEFGPAPVTGVTVDYELARFLRLEASSSQGPGAKIQRSLVERVERAGLDLIFFFSY